MKKKLVLICVVMMLLTSCGKKNDPHLSTPSSFSGNTEEQGNVPAGEDLPVSDKKDTVLNTNAEAFTLEPCEGIAVNVPAGTVYQDTVLTIEPVREDTPHIREIIEDFYEQDMFALNAWEVDAGLEGDECLPGAYEVSIDLDVLGIPDTLRDSLSIYRISDEGSYSELISSVEGNRLVYSSRQNSVEMMIYSSRKTVEKVLPVVNFSVLDVLELKTRYYYWKKFATEGSFWYTTEVTTEDGSFTVTWTYDDLDPDRAAKTKRMDEISESYKKTIREDTTIEKRSSLDIFGLFSSGQTEAELLKEALEKDEEYQRLNKEYETPKLLDDIIRYISLSFYFLKEKEKIKMPEATVNYYLLTDMNTVAQGTSNWSYGAQSFIEINMRDVNKMVKEDEAGKTARENLSLTLTHELFHVCQENYHTHLFSDSVRFDEMTAVVLESDARDYYYDNGIISTKPPLTEQNQWKRLERSTDDDTLDKDTQTEQGYNLSLYYIYLREKEGKEAPVAEIMNARSYFEKPKTSAILSEVFGLTEEQYQKRWFGFCKKYRKQAASLNQQRNLVEANKGIHFDLMNTEDYALRTVGLEQRTKTPMPLLVIPDNISTVSDQRAAYLPADNYSVYKKGYYVPPTGNNRRWMTEIYGKQDGEQMPGYTVYGFGQTPQVKIDINRNKDRIELYMTEESELARDKLVEGYFIKVDADSGFKAQGHKTLEEMEKGIGVSFDKIYNGDDTKDAAITVTVCEYVSDNEGNHYYGIESEATDYTLKAREEEGEEILNVDAEPISDEDQFLSSMSFGYPLDMVLYDAGHSSSTEYEGSFHEHIINAYDEIAETLIGKTMVINSDGSFSFTLPLTSASDHWETKANPDCYVDVTSSFTITGHMAPYEELHTGDELQYGPREEDIDYGFPVIDTAVYNGSVNGFHEMPLNSDSQSRKIYVLEITGEEAELSEWGTKCTILATYYKPELEKYGIEEGKDYLHLELNIKFMTRWKGTLDWEHDASGWMAAHSSHSDYDWKVKESYILDFVSRQQISRYKREIYEKH